jgi:Domain of unknown function DUF11
MTTPARTLIRLAALGLLVCATWGIAQQPPSLPALNTPFTDPNVEQIQRLEPPVKSGAPRTIDDAPRGTTVPTGVSTGPVMANTAVTDLSPPRLQLSVRTPSHIAPNTPVPYTISILNIGSTKALRVKIKMKMPEGAEGIKSAEPKIVPDAATKELVWDIGNLAPNDRKEIKLEFNPKADAKEVKGTAYVSFEYGAIVETKIEAPKLTVKKTMTPQVAEGELVTVQVVVTNTSKTPVPNVGLLENNAAEAEYRGTQGSKPATNSGQRRWDLGTLGAGQTKTVTYQLLHKKDGTHKSISNVTSDVTMQSASDEATTMVMKPALEFKLSKNQEKDGQVTATIKNSGTLPLENVQVLLDIPEGVRISNATKGSEKNRRGDQMRWLLPKLPAGESQEYRAIFEPEQNVSGQKVITGRVSEARRLVDVPEQKVMIDYVGKADLTWKPVFDTPVIDLNRQGTIKVKVTNNGNATDKSIVLRIGLPANLKAVLDDRGVDKVQLNEKGAVFAARELAPGKSHEFVLNYQGISTGTENVQLMLTSESLGKVTLTKNQSITVGK